MGIKVPGFRVVPSKKNSAKEMRFEVWLTIGSPADPFFFTSPAAREAINNFKKFSPSAQSMHLGEVNYLLEDEKSIRRIYGDKSFEKVKAQRIADGVWGKPAYYYEFFPFSSMREEGRPNLFEEKYFGKKGIALNIERITLREVLKVNPKALLFPSAFMTDLREQQLIRRGMRVTSTQQIFSAREVMRSIKENINAYRKKRRNPLPGERLTNSMLKGIKLSGGRKQRVLR